MKISNLYNTFTKLKLNLLGVESRNTITKYGIQHFYDFKGAGKFPTLIILHGIGANANAFESLVISLRKYFRRIILPEAPAHGFSTSTFNEVVDAEAVYFGMVELINNIIDKKVIIFGNSMGGGIASKYSASYSENVRGLILCSPGGADMNDEDWKKFLERFKIRNNIEGILFYNKIVSKPSLKSILSGSYIFSTLGDKNIQELIQNLPIDYLVKKEELQKLNMPIQLIWGKKDKLMLEEHKRFYFDNLPKNNTEIIEPDDFGHCPFIDNNNKLVSIMLKFINKNF
jgi:pimeloyl-ACP methyl ester carboxylesterase